MSHAADDNQFNTSTLDYSGENFPFFICCDKDCEEEIPGNCFTSQARCTDFQTCWKLYEDTDDMNLRVDPSAGVHWYMWIISIGTIILLFIMLWMIYHTTYHFGLCHEWCYTSWVDWRFRHCFYLDFLLDFDEHKITLNERSIQRGSKRAPSHVVSDEDGPPSGPSSPAAVEYDEAGNTVRTAKPSEAAPELATKSPRYKDIVQSKSEDMTEQDFTTYLRKMSNPRGLTVPKAIKALSVTTLVLFYISVVAHLVQVLGLLYMYNEGTLCEKYMGPGEDFRWICYGLDSRFSSLDFELDVWWAIQFTTWFLGKDALYLLIGWRLYLTFKRSVYRFHETQLPVPKQCQNYSLSHWGSDKLRVPTIGFLLVFFVLFQTIITFMWGIAVEEVTISGSWVAWVAFTNDLFISSVMLGVFVVKLNRLIIDSAIQSSQRTPKQAPVSAPRIEDSNGDEYNPPPMRLSAVEQETAAHLDRHLSTDLGEQSRMTAKQSAKLISVATKQCVLTLVVFGTSVSVMCVRSVFSDASVSTWEAEKYLFESIFATVVLDCFVNCLGIWLIFKFSENYYYNCCSQCDRLLSYICLNIVSKQIKKDLKAQRKAESQAGATYDTDLR